MTRREWLALAMACAGSWATPARADAPGSGGSTPVASGRRVYLQPLGAQLPEEAVTLIEQALLAFYDIELVRLGPVPLPRAAYYPPRQRYRAERLLEFLERKVPPDGYRVLGVTGVDISTTKGAIVDWGVMGLGSLDGKTCVLSSFRAARGAKSAAHARIRFAKTAVHELGHTFGLEHCATRGCLMEDGQGTVFTTDREYDLCGATRTRLVATGHPLAEGRPIPWPRPPAT